MRRLARPILLLVAASTVAGCGDEQPPVDAPPDDGHLACGSDIPPAPGNECCADGQQRPDCTLEVSHSGYWETLCAEPLGTTCTGLHTETFQVAVPGTLIGLYTTGPFHVMPGQVSVMLDGAPADAFEALLPGGTVNAPVTLGSVGAGAHTIILQFSSTNGGTPGSWGGYLDLFVKT